MQDAVRLLDIHEKLTGTARGRRRGVEVLNKSALVFVTASWEAVVEDAAAQLFDMLMKGAKSFEFIPTKVRACATEMIRKSQDERRIWELAGEGWKSVLLTHREEILRRYIGPLNTPSSDNVDRLFESLIGLRHISSSWHWPKMSVASARSRLDEHLRVRAAVAHGLPTPAPITKPYVEQYVDFILRLGFKTIEAGDAHIRELLRAPEL